MGIVLHTRSLVTTSRHNASDHIVVMDTGCTWVVKFKMDEYHQPPIVLHRGLQPLRTFHFNHHIKCAAQNNDAVVAHYKSGFNYTATLCSVKNYTCRFRFYTGEAIFKFVYIKMYRFYIAACRDMTLRVFSEDFKTLQVLHVSSTVLSLEFNEEKSELFAGGVGYIDVWELRNQLHSPLNYRTTIRFSSTKTQWVISLNLDVCAPRLVATCHKDVYIIDSECYSEIDRYSNLQRRTLSCAVLFAALKYLIIGAKDGCVLVWDYSLHSEIHVFTGHTKAVTGINIYPLAPCVISCSLDGTLRCWHMETLTECYRLTCGEELLGMDINCTASGSTVMCFSHWNIHVWEATKMENHFSSINSDLTKISRAEGSMENVSRLIAMADDGGVRVFSPVTGQMITILFPDLSSKCIQDVAYSCTGKLIYTLLRGGEVIFYTTATNPCSLLSCIAPPNEENEVTCLATGNLSFVDDGLSVSVLFGGLRSGYISLLDGGGVFSMAHPFPAHLGEVVVLRCPTSFMMVSISVTCFYPCHLLSYGEDQLLKLWTIVIKDNKALSLKHFRTINIGSRPEHIDMLDSLLCFVLNGKVLMVETRMDSGSALSTSLNFDDGLLISHQPEDDHSTSVTSLSCCPTLMIFATSSSNGQVKIWNEKNQLLSEICFDNAVTAIGFANPKGDLLVGFQKQICLICSEDYLPAKYLKSYVTEDGVENPIPFNSSLEFWSCPVKQESGIQYTTKQLLYSFSRVQNCKSITCTDLSASDDASATSIPPQQHRSENLKVRNTNKMIHSQMVGRSFQTQLCLIRLNKKRFHITRTSRPAIKLPDFVMETLNNTREVVEVVPLTCASKLYRIAPDGFIPNSVVRTNVWYESLSAKESVVDEKKPEEQLPPQYEFEAVEEEDGTSSECSEDSSQSEYYEAEKDIDFAASMTFEEYCAWLSSIASSSQLAQDPGDEATAQTREQRKPRTLPKTPRYDSFELLVFNRDHQEAGDLDMHHVSGVRHLVPDSNVATASGGMELHASTTAQNTDNTTGEDTQSVVKESSVISASTTEFSPPNQKALIKELTSTGKLQVEDSAAVTMSLESTYTELMSLLSSNEVASFSNGVDMLFDMRNHCMISSEQEYEIVCKLLKMVSNEKLCHLNPVILETLANLGFMPRKPEAECNYETLLSLLTSTDAETFNKGVKMLYEMKSLLSLEQRNSLVSKLLSRFKSDAFQFMKDSINEALQIFDIEKTPFEGLLSLLASENSVNFGRGTAMLAKMQEELSLPPEKKDEVVCQLLQEANDDSFLHLRSSILNVLSRLGISLDDSFPSVTSLESTEISEQNLSSMLSSTEVEGFTKGVNLLMKMKQQKVLQHEEEYDAIKKLFRKMRSECDEDGDTKNLSVKALQCLGIKVRRSKVMRKTVEELLSRMRNGSDLDVKETISLVVNNPLTAEQRTEVIDRLLKCLTSTDELDERAMILTALPDIGCDENVVMNIFPFLIDADERVCTEALTALHRITGVSNRSQLHQLFVSFDLVKQTDLNEDEILKDLAMRVQRGEVKNVPFSLHQDTVNSERSEVKSVSNIRPVSQRSSKVVDLSKPLSPSSQFEPGSPMERKHQAKKHTRFSSRSVTPSSVRQKDSKSASESLNQSVDMDLLKERMVRHIDISQQDGPSQHNSRLFVQVNQYSSHTELPKGKQSDSDYRLEARPNTAVCVLRQHHEEDMHMHFGDFTADKKSSQRHTLETSRIELRPRSAYMYRRRHEEEPDNPLQSNLLSAQEVGASMSASCRILVSPYIHESKSESRPEKTPNLTSPPVCVQRAPSELPSLKRFPPARARHDLRYFRKFSSRTPYLGDRDVVLRPGFQDSHMRTPFHRVSLPQGHVTDGNNNLDTQPQAPVLGSFQPFPDNNFIHSESVVPNASGPPLKGQRAIPQVIPAGNFLSPSIVSNSQDLHVLPALSMHPQAHTHHQIQAHVPHEVQLHLAATKTKNCVEISEIALSSPKPQSNNIFAFENPTVKYRTREQHAIMRENQVVPPRCGNGLSSFRARRHCNAPRKLPPLACRPVNTSMHHRAGRIIGKKQSPSEVYASNVQQLKLNFLSQTKPTLEMVLVTYQCNENKQAPDTESYYWDRLVPVKNTV